MKSGVNDRTWDMIRDRRDERTMTRAEYEALSRYWRVRRYAAYPRHAHGHNKRLLREAESRLTFAVVMAVFATRFTAMTAAFGRAVAEALKPATRAFARLAAAYPKEDE